MLLDLYYLDLFLISKLQSTRKKQKAEQLVWFFLKEKDIRFQLTHVIEKFILDRSQYFIADLIFLRQGLT